MFKSVYRNNDGELEFNDDNLRYKFDAAKMREVVAKRIVISKA